MTSLRASLFATIIASLTACGGSLEIQEEPDAVQPKGDIQSQTYSSKAYEIAHKMIIATRPQATEMMIKQLNLVLANNNIIGTVVRSVEDKVESPLTDGRPQNTCPYLTKQNAGNSMSCRYLVDRAVEDALVSAPNLQTVIEQDANTKYSAVLKMAEMDYVRSWVGQAVLSGIDVGAIHAIDTLRERKACDQAPTPKQSAFALGSGQGRAQLEATERRVLPTIPRTICNTDVIANTIFAEAKKGAAGYMAANPVCAGHKATDLAVAVDLAQAETNRKTGFEQGMRQGYEALRVRLVQTWRCIRPAGGGGGTGDPLVVDLDHNGVSFESARGEGFDLAATGEKVQMPALSGADALLALDRDGNGRIDSGAELFGNAAACGSNRCTDGVEALARFDHNRDGKIDSDDAVFARLKLWRDANHDGKSSDDELSSLSAAGILAIRLEASTARAFDKAGNSSIRSLSFDTIGGGEGVVYDVWFSFALPNTLKDHRSIGLTSTIHQRFAR